MKTLTFNIIFLVTILLIVIGFSVDIFLTLRKEKNMVLNTVFPPFKNKCPDYWEVTKDDKCLNKNNIGLCKTSGDRKMDFNQDIYSGEKGDYYKCAWSKQCQAPWEGIDNLC